MARATVTTLSRNCAATAPMPAHSLPARSHLRFPPSSLDRLVPVSTINPLARRAVAPNDVPQSCRLNRRWGGGAFFGAPAVGVLCVVVGTRMLERPVLH